MLCGWKGNCTAGGRMEVYHQVYDLSHLLTNIIPSLNTAVEYGTTFTFANSYLVGCGCVFIKSGKPARWRDFHSATGIGDKMYIFGGRSDRAGPYHTNSELYCPKIQVFDTVHNTWSEPQAVGNIPCGRRSHSACMHAFTVFLQNFC